MPTKQIPIGKKFSLFFAILFGGLYKHLVKAIDERNIELVRHILRIDKSLMNMPYRGNSILHFAAREDDEGLARVLIEEGANVNALFDGETSPLDIAISKNNDAVARLLIHHDANIKNLKKRIQIYPGEGVSCLQAVAAIGSPRLAQYLLENGVLIKGHTGRTPLHIAVEYRNYPVAELLIDKGAPLDAKNNMPRNKYNFKADGETPLHIAAQESWQTNMMSMMKLLIQKGANVNASDNQGETPLHTACYYIQTDAIKLLLEHGANVNASDNQGETPLHKIISTSVSDFGQKKEDMIKLLIDKGADVNAFSNWKTPLEAVGSTEHSIIELLRSHGAVDYSNLRSLTNLEDSDKLRALLDLSPNLINYRNKNYKMYRDKEVIYCDKEGGNSLLHFTNQPDIALLLIEKGIDVNITNNKKETPLHRCNAEVAKVLLLNGADVECRAEWRETPLHFATRLGDIDKIKVLLDHGADVNARDYHTWCPLHYAAKYAEDVYSLDPQPHYFAKEGKNVPLVKLLLDNGADINALADTWYTSTGNRIPGGTPLELAKHPEVIRLLRDRGGRVGKDDRS